MQSSARVTAVQPGVLRRHGGKARGKTVHRPQAQAGVRQAGGVFDAVVQGYVSDGTISREEASSMSPDQLEFLIRKRTRNNDPSAFLVAPQQQQMASPPTQASVQEYINQGVITREEVNAMSSTQLEFLIRKRTRDASGSPVPPPAASSAVSYRPAANNNNNNSNNNSGRSIASTPVSGGMASGLDVNEAELSSEQLELLQEYIRIKEQEELLQQQEYILQQQVASLKTEVEELEGTSGGQAQSVFRDAPPLRDGSPSPGPHSAAASATSAMAQRGAAPAGAISGAADAAKAAVAANPWAAVAAGAVAIVGLSAGVYFAPNTLFKPKPVSDGLQQKAPATATNEAARLVDRPSQVPAIPSGAGSLTAAQEVKEASDAQKAAEATVASQAKAGQYAKAAQAKAAAEAKVAEEQKSAAEARAAVEAKKAAEAKASADAQAAAQAKAAEAKAAAEARAATEAKAVAEARAAEEAKKGTEAKAAMDKAAAEAKAAQEAKAVAEARGVAEAKAAQESKANTAVESKQAEEAAAMGSVDLPAPAVKAMESAAPKEQSKSADVAKAAAVVPGPSLSSTWQSLFGQKASTADKPAADTPSKVAAASVPVPKVPAQPSYSPLTLSAEAEAMKAKMQGGSSVAATPSSQEGSSSFKYGLGAEAGAFLTAGIAAAAALAVRSGYKNPANLLRTAEVRVTSLRESLTVQQADLQAAQGKVVEAQAEYARGLAALRTANSELQNLSSRVLSSEKAANALVADLDKLNKKGDKNAARLRSEAATIASQVTKQRELVSAQVMKQRQVVEAALNKALAEVASA